MHEPADFEIEDEPTPVRLEPPAPPEDMGDEDPFESPSAEPVIREGPTEPRGGGCFAFLKETFITFVFALTFYLAINALTARVQVLGYSMVPTFRGGEYILVWRLAYLTHPPRRGDIVVFQPENSSQEYIKRVIGLPGEEVLIQNGRVFINGEPLEEPYIPERPRYEGYWRIPPGHVFVLGDNRNHSTDSHVFGPIPMDRIVGKAVLVYWPPDAWRVLP